MPQSHNDGQRPTPPHLTLLHPRSTPSLSLTNSVAEAAIASGTAANALGKIGNGILVDAVGGPRFIQTDLAFAAAGCFLFGVPLGGSGSASALQLLCSRALHLQGLVGKPHLREAREVREARVRVRRERQGEREREKRGT